MATLSRLMPSDQPLMINPVRYAKQGKSIKATYEIEQFMRLKSLLQEHTGDVCCDLYFDYDEEYQIYNVTGSIKTLLKLYCQRCLESMDVEINNTVSLGIVGSDKEADELPAKYEPLFYTTEPISLPELIEDELILSVPLAAFHENTDCAGSKGIKQEIIENRNRPFENLEKLIQLNSKNSTGEN